jgi:hypothetical protein
MKPLIFAFLFIWQSFALHVPLQAVKASKPHNRLIVVNENVVLIGKFVMAEGTDDLDRRVPYKAIKLDQPIDIKTEDGIKEDNKYLKIFFKGLPASSFSKNQGKRLRVSGKVQYYWFGPSTYPNPAKFEISKIERY